MPEISESSARIWRILAGVSVLAFVGTSIWWFFHIPSVGKGGVLLAVGATLMPLFWDKVGTTPIRLSPKTRRMRPFPRIEVGIGRGASITGDP
jgi:hypothetical protein